MSVAPFIEAHMHADCRSGEEFERLASAGCRGVVAVAGASGGFGSAAGLKDYFRRLARLDRARIERAGLKAWVALGIHPAGIPESDPDRAIDGLRALLEDGHAAAVGEVGLERGGELEERVLSGCMRAAAELELPLLLHTPRREKRAMLERSLELLRSTDLAPERVLADHLDESCLELAGRAGCWLGLSVHPAKLSAAQAAELVDRHGPARVVITSDTGGNPSYLFALPAFVAAADERGLPSESIKACVLSNAAAWMGVHP